MSVEAASTCGCEHCTGMDGAMLGMHRFGASAPVKDMMNAFGFAAENIVEAAKAQIAKWTRS
ncbi:MAG: hypothetical protein ABSC37_07095 [Xanthobacteraceae bacterium]